MYGQTQTIKAVTEASLFLEKSCLTGIAGRMCIWQSGPNEGKWEEHRFNAQVRIKQLTKNQGWIDGNQLNAFLLCNFPSSLLCLGLHKSAILICWIITVETSCDGVECLKVVLWILSEAHGTVTC